MRTPFIILSSLIAVASLQAAEPTKEQLAFFDSKVLPVLKETCYKCHSAEANKAKGGLLVDSRDALMKGGDGGPAIVPGNPGASLLITAISYKDDDLQMPPKGEKLSDQQIKDLTEWVKMGAPDPRKADLTNAKLSGLTQSAKAHWSYQPVKKPAIPAVKNRAWCVTPVDAFILQKIEEKGMAPSPGLMTTQADKEILLRRATYDLIGMPPTPKEIESFLLDQSPYAFAKVVERLLASPHYGERWGRFWLDTARYADTTGDRENNMNQDYRYPYAWTYRDYVIRAFNDDKPYDRFIIEQLAADKLFDLKDPRDLAALGFITVGARIGNNNDIINDRIDVVSKGFLAMTVTCARCHDHMFDPIPTKDYYALHGVFSSIFEPKDKPIIVQANKSASAELSKKMVDLLEENRGVYYKLVGDENWKFRQKASAYMRAAYIGRNRTDTEALQKAQAIIDSEKLDQQILNYVGGRMRSGDGVFKAFRRFADGGKDMAAVAEAVSKDKSINPLIAQQFVSQAPSTMDDVAEIYARVFRTADMKGKEFVEASAAAKTKGDTVKGFDEPTQELLQVPFRVSLAYTLTREQIQNESNGWPNQVRNRAPFSFARMNEMLLTEEGVDARAMVVQDNPMPTDSPVFIRGQAGQRGEIVPRRFLEILSGGKPTPFKMGSGRLELAQAIASKNNPLTARVMVNRIWMHHFGEGFVRTPDDLGTQSEAPSHAELIDYLSWYFMEQGWSIKKMHRLIMLSRIYQVSSHTVQKHEEIDPYNRLLWRANVRRLDFEAVRDSLLVMSGRLDPTLYGQPVNLTDEPYSYRRSVYGYIDRGNLPELMAHFDFSNPEMTNSKRTTTIVPQQALFLMNSPMVIDVARRVLARPEVVNSTTQLNKIFNIYRVILQRSPNQNEIALALSFIGKEIKEEPQTLAAAKEITERAAKKAAEREKRLAAQEMGRGDSMRAISNDGQFIERKPLTPWETFAQALLLSNEAAYVN